MQTQNDLDDLYNLLLCAFPQGIPEIDYRPMLAILHAFMPVELIADLLAPLTGLTYEAVYEDAARFAYGEFPAYEEIEEVLQRLDSCGYDDWFKRQAGQV
ncbi:MAG: hypothetical protein H7X77_01950 [Anaerolineae bacterium]|nr:hypothetical protein [Anaerolineae bacterium]